MTQPPQKFDVFLSHNTRDKDTVERLAEILKREGIEPWLDKWCLTTATRFEDQLAAGIGSASSYAIFIGANGIGDWAREELAFATARGVKDKNFRVFLVLLPELPEPFDHSTLPPFLTTRTWVDMRKGVFDEKTLKRLVCAIQGVAPGPETPIEPRSDLCPYRGLQVFLEEHEEFFFGRDAEIQRLVEELKRNRLLAVVGPSGSGKSSLVRAGLLPALRKGALTNSNEWTIQVFTPGAAPLTSLVANLKRINPELSVGTVLDEFSTDQRTLHLQGAVALAGEPSTKQLIWVIDQFEEVFTLCHDETERRNFISNLLYAAFAPGGRNIVVLTMRADFYAKCAAYPELATQITGHQFLVSPLSNEGLRQVIEEPGWRVGLQFEPGLVDTILDDVESQPGALPLLEHALLEMWERRHAGLLSLQAYRESGSVTGAIAKRADTIFNLFGLEVRKIVRRVMLRLTQPGEGTEDTRRRVVTRELITHREETNKVEGVIQALTSARLLMTSREEDDEGTVEVSHEALIRGWPTLRRWIDEDRQGLRIHRRITEAATEWQKTKDESLLFRGSQLAQSLEFRDQNNSELNLVEREFLNAGRELEQRHYLAARRRFRTLIAVMAAALISISIAGVYAFVQKSNVYARALAANSMALLSVDPELALLLAIEASKTASSPEIEDALRQALIHAPLHIFERGEMALSDVASFSPDGKRFLIANGNKLQLYETESGHLLREFIKDAKILGIAYNPNGKLVGALIGEPYSSDNQLHIWNVDGNSVLQHKTSGYRVVFTPDGNFTLAGEDVIEISSRRVVAKFEGDFASFSSNGKTMMTLVGPPDPEPTPPPELDMVTPPRTATVVIYETADWKLRDKLQTTIASDAHTTTTPLAALSPDGETIFIGRELHFGLYRLQDKRFQPAAPVRPTSKPNDDKAPYFTEATSPVFSPDGKRMAFVTNEAIKPLPPSLVPEDQPNPNRTLQIWETNAPAPVIFDPSVGAVTELVFSPDGRFLVTGDSSAHLYDLESRRQLAELPRGASEFEFSADGRYLLGTSLNTSYLWDLSPWRSVVEIDTRTDDTNKKDGRILDIQLSIAEKPYVVTRQLLAAGGIVTRIWDGYSGQLISQTPNAQLRFMEITFSPDGRFLASLSFDERLEVWDLNTGKAQAAMELKGTEALSPRTDVIRFSPDGQSLLTFDTQKIRVWNTKDGAKLDEIHVTGSDFVTNGKLAAVLQGPEVEVINLNSKRTKWKFDGEAARPPATSFSLNRLILGFGSEAAVIDVNTGNIISELRGHVDEINSADFNFNSNFIVTTSAFNPDPNKVRRSRVPERENEVRVWNATTGTTVYEFRDHGTPIKFGKFSADGKFVLAADMDGRVRVYVCGMCMPPDELLKHAQGRRVRALTTEEKSRYLR